MRKFPVYRPGEEEDHDDGCRDPEGAVEIGVAVEGVEEVSAGIEGGPASL